MPFMFLELLEALFCSHDVLRNLYLTVCIIFLIVLFACLLMCLDLVFVLFF